MKLEIHYESEWAALYVDGTLDRVGDAYLAEERALELCGVTIVQDDAFMRGQKHRDGVAKTLTEVEGFRSQRDANLEIAAAKVEQARQLIAEVSALDPDGRIDRTIRPTS